MSFGHSSAVRFDVNHGAPGIFWQKNQPKTEKRKFGYKSKNLRHEIRRPDNSELIAEIERKKDEEKRKFNRDNKDFINKNRSRYQPREQVPQPGSTQITPGTVTLTQDQLAALLTSLSTLNKDGGREDASNPLKISFDTDTNKIEVQRYESDDDGDAAADGGSSPALGIYDLLGDGDVVSNKNSNADKGGRKANKKTRGSDQDTMRKREDRSRGEKKAEDNNEGNSPLNTARSTLNDTKKEAGVSHISPTVPLKHMTVGERKRLQWAMERAELEKEYDPWGRPGAGAPPGKTEEPKTEKKTTSRSKEEEADIKAKHRQQREDLESDIERLRKEIQEAEKQKEEEEQIIVNKILAEKQKKESRTEKRREKDDNGAARGKRSEDGTKKDAAMRSERQQKKKRDDSQSRNQNAASSDKVQIVFITKKRAKPDKESEDKEEFSITLNTSGLSNDAGGTDNDKDAKESVTKQQKKEKSRRDKGLDELPQESTNEKGAAGTESQSQKKPEELPKKKKVEETSKPSANKTAVGVATDDEEETAFLSKKEIERRKWVAELNKQRDELRLKKQMEKERDKAGVQDQWADRFVYHKSPVQTSPRRAKASPRDEAPALGRAPDTGGLQLEAPPAAMRSSMVIGAGTMNETRFDSKKAEEKRQWLEELEKQRDAKRQQEVARKEKERQEDGMWADRYPTDRHKINQFANANKSPRAPINVNAEPERHHRVSSAPEPAGGPTLNLGVGDSQEQPTTFLRGQGVYVDPVTRKEQEEKRRLHQEYQMEIKRQIEEKERQKREERERKAREDMEEERKFQMERDRVQRQEEAEKKLTRDREAQQQKHLANLKSAMEEAEERAKEDKNLRRMQHLQQRGHDIAGLKATYEAITPRIKEYEATTIPGLGGGGGGVGGGQNNNSSPLPSEQVFVPGQQQPTARDVAPPRGGVSHHQPHPRGGASHHQPHPMGQSYTKEPYVEDRVLTPSRHRNPSKPWDNPNSPKREFGTQTLELKDLQSILSNLPDDIQIEYKMRVEEALKEKQDKKPPGPSRKVHSKSADTRMAKAGNNNNKTSGPNAAATRRDQQSEMKERRVASKDRNMKIGERPQWGQRKIKAMPKNSEKDPFYQQKKEESEARKAKRERQLQYLQELNKERIPNLSPTRARASSPDQGGGNPGGDRGRGRDPRGGARHGNRRDASNGNKQNQRGGSPNILTLAHDLESKNAKGGFGGASAATTGRSSSPPLPTVKHKTVSSRNDHNNYYHDDNDAYYYTNNVLKNSHSEGRYDDLAVATAAPVHDGDFIPFTRTTEILDPARADEPMAISRENSRMERARRAYHETRQPANRGRPLNVLQDRERETALKVGHQH